MEHNSDQHNVDFVSRPYSKALMAGCASLALLGPVVGMSAAAARFVPATVEYAPGLSADVSLQYGQDSATIATGALGSLHIPGISREFPVVGSVSPYIRVNEVGLKLDAGPDTFTQYSFLAKDYEARIVQPTETAIKNRLVAGAAAGAAVDLALAGGYIGYRRRQQRQAGQAAAAQNLREQLADYPDLSAQLNSALGSKQPRQPQPNHEVGRRILVVAGAAGMVLTACALDTIPVSRITGPAAAIEAPLNPSITERLPILKTATVTGLGGDAINTAVDRIEKEVQRTDKTWNRAVANLDTAFREYTNGEGLAYADDPDIVAVMHITDIHCNYAYMQKIFDQLLRKFQVQIVLNTGDTYLTTGSLPFESDCLPELLEQMQPDNQRGRKVVMMYFRGNHDPKQLPDSITERVLTDEDGEEFKPIIELDKDNKFTATEQDITFVGAPDPTSSGLEGTMPHDHDEQDALIREQGHQIAEAACKATIKNGKRPLVAAHHPEALYETLARGCGDTFSGHTHRTSGPDAYETVMGDIVHERVLGSSGGAPIGRRAGITITQYAVPTSDSVSSIELVNKKTGQVEKSILVTVTPDGDVTIQEKLPPATAVPVAENPAIDAFSPHQLVGMPY